METHSGFTVFPPPLPQAGIAGKICWFAALLAMAMIVMFLPFDGVVTLVVVVLISLVMFILAVRITVQEPVIGLVLLAALLMLPVYGFLLRLIGKMIFAVVLMKLAS